MTADEARERFAAARVARLATVASDGSPHVVPIVFAIDGDTVYHAIDRKPKRTTRLRRLENIAVEPRAAVLADEYGEDWGALWWVRGDGLARVLARCGDEERAAHALLRDRYPQYRAEPPPGPVVALDVARWSGWRAG
jgi:PPOX class probable F420-dependent enzyme